MWATKRDLDCLLKDSSIEFQIFGPKIPYVKFTIIGSNIRYEVGGIRCELCVIRMFNKQKKGFK